MQMTKQLKGKEQSYPVERAVFLGAGLLAVWFIAMMTFMENGPNHLLGCLRICCATRIGRSTGD